MGVKKLSIKNFGPIDEAEIDISPLTVFVGKNSCGKSFLSMLINCLSNPFDEINSNYNSQMFPIHSYNFLIENNEELFLEFENELKKYLESKPSFSDDPFKFPKIKFDSLIYEGFGKCYTKLIENKLKNNWKTSLNNLNRVNIHPFEISFNGNVFKNEFDNLVNLNCFKNSVSEFGIVNEINAQVVNINFEDELRINLNFKLWNKFYGDKDVSLAQVIYILYIDKLISALKYNTVYVPAGGEIFKDFNNFMSKEIKGISESPNIQKEFILNLLEMNKGTEKGYFYDLVVEMEHEINGGELQFKKGDLKDELIFVDSKNNMELDLNLVSSSIRELIPIIIYLKYYLNKGDTLIIEEIENHLHPKNQLILVKYLVKAINKGLNIILTTHSDFIIEKFNNFIRLGNASQKAFDELNYDKTCVLDYEVVNIYNFKKNDDYSYTPYLINLNFTGFNDDNFAPVIHELYEESGIIIDNKLR